MSLGTKVLVLGGTGPAGICLLRELVHRNHTAVVYARNPSKLPAELATHPQIVVISGEMSDLPALSVAMTGCSTVISLLGPDIKHRDISPTIYPDMYKSSIFLAMRQHGVRRILAMNTISVARAGDFWTLMAPMGRNFMRMFAGAIYENMIKLAELFEHEDAHLDWTMYRIGMISGESDEVSWKRDRWSGQVYEGPIGGRGWKVSLKRGLLARWLVDMVEDETKKWLHDMPTVGQLADSGA